MEYQFSTDQIAHAKLKLKDLEKKKRMWEAERERAIHDKKKYGPKYSKNIGERIHYAEKQIMLYQEKIDQFKEMIEKGSIEL